MSRSVRLLTLLQFLRGRRTPVAEMVMAEHFGVSERTIYRDIAALIAEGAPIRGEAGIGYVLEAGFFLPPLMLEPDEVEAIVLGLSLVDQRGDAVLRGAASTALAKIDAVLSSGAKEGRNTPICIPGPAVRDFAEEPVSLVYLREAIRTQTKLHIRYADAAGTGTERIIWPIALGFLDGVRILVAWCELREAFRTFRTDRVLSAVGSGRYSERRSVLLKRMDLSLSPSY